MCVVLYINRDQITRDVICCSGKCFTVRMYWKITTTICKSLRPLQRRGKHKYFLAGFCCNCSILKVLIRKRSRRVQMGEVVHTSKIKIVREKGPTRRAMIEGFSEPVYYGVHGGIMKFYKVEPEKEHAATLDHIVAATAG